MYIYNMTINIQEEVHDQWLKWMKEEQIPEMLKTGKFTKALMTKVLVKEEMGGITYSVQFSTKSRALLKSYYREDSERLRKGAKAFEGKFVSFETELEVVLDSHLSE